eukprot:UN01147
MALVIYFMNTKEWRFFISMDLIVNLSCVVFTYKFSVNTMCPSCYENYKKNGNSNNNFNGDNGHKHTAVKQESTFSQQPNDSQVWKMLVKSQHECVDSPECTNCNDIYHQSDQTDGRSGQSRDKTDVEKETEMI